MNQATTERLEQVYLEYTKELHYVLGKFSGTEEITEVWTKDFYQRLSLCGIEEDEAKSVHLMINFFQGAFGFLTTFSTENNMAISRLQREMHTALCNIDTTLPRM